MAYCSWLFAVSRIEPDRLPRGRRGLAKLGRLRVEDRAPAAELERQVDDRDEDDQVDQQVLDHRDQRRRPQARLVGVGGEHHEGDEQRGVAPEARAVEAHGAQHGLEAGELQGDVGHRRDDPGDRDEQRQRRGAVAPAHEVGRRHVAVHPRDRPQAQQRQHDQRERDDRVGDGEEADRAGARTAAPGSPRRCRRCRGRRRAGTTSPTSRTCGRRGPTRRGARCRWRPPAARHEAHDRHGEEQQGEDDELDDLRAGHCSPSSST